MKRVVSWLVSLGLALDLVGCAVAEPPRLVSIANPPEFRPKIPQQVKTLEQAMAAIITVCSKDLGLPVVEPFYVHLYKDANAYAGYTLGFARLPEQIVRLTLAIPSENRLHINMERVQGRPWGSLLKILAHEYAHNVEYVVIGSTRPWVQWMREGFADWVAAKVLDSLGWESYPSALARAKRELSRNGNALPKFSQLENTKDWLNTVDQPKGKVKTYGLAFVAMDRLIEKRGLSGMMNYFKSDDFQGSFRLTWSDFERELEGVVNHLVAAKAVRRSGLKAERRPDWKIGYQWRYAVTGPGIKATALNEVVREETFDSVPVYVLRVGKNEHIHTKDTLSVLATLSGGKTVTKNNPPLLLLSWPLEVGKEWRNSFLVENVEQKSSQRIDMEVVVADVEQVKVPAGVFEAFRIETYAFQTGELISEQWYAPQVKGFVKSRTYRQEGPVDLELVSYKVD